MFNENNTVQNGITRELTRLDWRQVPALVVAQEATPC
jgi:hypothetical protein